MSTTTTDPAGLVTRARKANAEHRAIGKAHSRMLEHAIEAGRQLIEAKDALDYGQWGPWCSEHLEFSERTARVYMQLASAPAQERQSSAEVSIVQALRQIAEPRPPSTSDTASLLRSLARENGEHTPAPKPSTPQATAPEWTAAQERKWERARILVEESLAALIDGGSDGKLSEYAVSQLLRGAAVKARHGAAALDELAFTFEQ